MEYHRHFTPPSMIEIESFDYLQCPGGSASTTASYFPQDQDWSPETVLTTATTPPRSPIKIRETGPLLLPRVRVQDQIMDVPPKAPQFHGYGHGHGHCRTISLPANAFPIQFGGHRDQRPSFDRRSTSPQGRHYISHSVSAPSPLGHMMNDSASSRRPSIVNARSVSASTIRSHSRSGSSSSIDASMLSRYGYPTYRQSPTPQPTTGISAPPSRTPSAMNHLAPIAMPSGQIQSYPSNRRTASPPANLSRLATEIDFDPNFDLPTLTALEYLTAPNPTPSLVHRTVESGRGLNTHFWYDVRNVRAWTNFNTDAISSFPILQQLLEIGASKRDLPTPTRPNLNPETAGQLAEVCAAHHAFKVNSVLKLTQGANKHMSMRAMRSAPVGARPQPDFVSNYQSDGEKTIFGDGRGRVIGIVKCYDQWNSGMRSGSPTDRVKYLQHLSHLQRFLREHGTRYGFIMTEIELVCVRAGGPPEAAASATVHKPLSGLAGPNVPLFGYIEVSPPVQIATSGARNSQTDKLQMTAGLALWWLHILAQEHPLGGPHLHWRMDVGGPAALTRQHHLPRDEWMPKGPNVSEKREAKRVRGWVMPEEPLSKRECGRGRKKV
ncbi:Hypothetical protein R9X50_00485100 [Acrodontium crateriforme]|uniref:Sialidase n=1 Tax=Acrodontium crateriforme TaxID=150365 RepID=A0AAQ3MBP9_9PEZI|nr:Hypothetical protein R9X50_00485100 [Acrodontium crateriforme]